MERSHRSVFAFFAPLRGDDFPQSREERKGNRIYLPASQILDATSCANPRDRKKIAKTWDKWDKTLNAINAVSSLSQGCPKLSHPGTKT